MSHYRLISLNIMTSHKSHRTMKRPRKNQRGGNMVLRSGTSTGLKGITNKRLIISIYLSLAPVLKVLENNEKT